MKWVKPICISLVCLALSACSLSKPIAVVKDAGINAGQFIGVVDTPVTIKKPDYYSTKQIPKSYEYGKEYGLTELDCSQAANNCR